MCCTTKQRRLEGGGGCAPLLKLGSERKGVRVPAADGAEARYLDGLTAMQAEESLAPGAAGAAALRAMLLPEASKADAPGTPTYRPARSCFSFEDCDEKVCRAQSPCAGHALPEDSVFKDNGNGNGQQIWPDGATYEGQYKDGRKHGMGRFLWTSGSTYDGNFAEGRLEGSGVLKWPDGSFYSGTWKDGRMHGSGKFTWPDGRSYEGEYCEDLKHGRGVFKWPDGSRYDGQWKDGMQHGSGTCTSAAGKKKLTQWNAGQRVRAQSRH